jgi:hypothetical protein
MHERPDGGLAISGHDMARRRTRHHRCHRRSSISRWIVQRVRFKCDEGHFRYGLIEAGRLDQNPWSVTGPLGVRGSSVRRPGVYELLGVDGVEEVSLYLRCLVRLD